MMAHQRGAESTWRRYWSETPDSRYLVAEARHFVSNLVSTLALNGTERVLDFGCGYGYVADALATHVAEIRMWDAVPPVLEAAAGRVTAENVSPIDWDHPDSVDAQFDLVVANSVVQYLTLNEFSECLHAWRNLLAPGGTAVISDVPPVDPPLGAEALHWLTFSARNRILIPSVRFAWANGARYRRARSESPLLILDLKTMERLAAAAGYSARMLPANLGYQKHRSTYLLSPLHA